MLDNRGETRIFATVDQLCEFLFIITSQTLGSIVSWRLENDLVMFAARFVNPVFATQTIG